jgi:predicted DNA-binding protein with PD1-like motif
MRWKLLDRGPPATWAVVLTTGDEAVGVLGEFAKQHDVPTASVPGIGTES